MPQVGTLEQLRAQLARGFFRPPSGRLPWPSIRYKDRLVYDEYLPDVLKGLVIGSAKLPAGPVVPVEPPPRE
jgi:hypothetical protein